MRNRSSDLRSCRRHVENEERVPFVIYGDFECLTSTIEPPGNSNGNASEQPGNDGDEGGSVGKQETDYDRSIEQEALDLGESTAVPIPNNSTLETLTWNSDQSA